ncbi:MAG: hypothetical protein IPJ61_21155 [Tessaracoccus sp.]|uniref:hypothetical protein n=1 Tax=Tessaracoccus sp. TaxID=1971211 RepID=UPI001EC162CB|nr:hypothetical protein [Tessaracoccus sp.]MBK7823497.1 hypothetical protein [Tessaracoccus sp.]
MTNTSFPVLNAHTLATTMCATNFEAGEIQRLTTLLTAGGSYVGPKLDEYRKQCHTSSLIAELRMALAVATWTRSTPVFCTGDEPDLRFPAIGDGFSVEVVHGSAPNGFQKVFYPAQLSAGPRRTVRKDWERARDELQAVVQARPITITPWIDGALQDHHFDFNARRRQEELAAEVARWLVVQLRGLAPGRRVELVHANARFEIDWQSEGAGRIGGFGPLAANFLQISGVPGDRDTMNNWLEIKLRKKATAISRREIKLRKKATAISRRAPREVSLVGLVIDDAYALRVDALANHYFGARVHDAGGTRPASYRPIPSALVAALDARRAHRSQAIAPLSFHPVDDESHRSMSGLFFRPEFADIDGILALYHTGALQFLSNPLARRPIEHLFAHLPPDHEAREHAAAAEWAART